jgi:SulP family sulfate permease
LNVDRWTPSSILAFRGRLADKTPYKVSDFRHDLLAGVTVGLVALPLAMAFAISSGLKPETGLYCAVVAGFLISALGGSRFQIGGPTGAFVTVVAGVVAQYGLSGLLMATMMAGAILLVLGATGLGTAVRYIPQPVVIGFTNGIAIVIASTQLRDLFGLEVSAIPGEFVPRMQALAAAWATWSPLATLLGVATLAFLIVWRRFNMRLPGYILALLAGTALVAIAGLDIATIGSRFGGIPSGLPSVAMPEFRVDLMLTLLSPAMTIAMLGAVESLMSAVVADRMGGDRHNPNVELIAQGLANIAAPLVGGLPATGAIARTATNIRSGARSPVAGMVHALTIAVVLVAAAPLARFVPLAVLAGILLMVAWQMGEWQEIPHLLKLSRADIAVWFTTFALTVMADLTVAVEVGMVLAMLMFIRRVAGTTTVTTMSSSDLEDSRLHVVEDKHLPDYVAVFRVYGPLMFGAADKLQKVSDHLAELPLVVIVKLRHMTAIDATGLRALEDLRARLATSGRHLIVAGAHPQPAALMAQSGFADRLGAENVCANTALALRRAKQIHSQFTIHHSKLRAPA